MAAVTEEQWQRAFAMDKGGQALCDAYHKLEALTPKDFWLPGKVMSPECEALRVLGKAIEDMRQYLPNAFPGTYNED